MIDEDAIAAVIGNISSGATPTISGALRSPGMLQKHYSPKAKLKILNWRDEADLRAQLKSVADKRTHIIAHSRIPSGEDWARVSVIPHDAEAFARAIYAELHQCDEVGAELIVVEAPPDTSEWRAIADRLHRAAAS
jgi:L-threonylcarbamoyladenylate synthase